MCLDCPAPSVPLQARVHPNRTGGLMTKGFVQGFIRFGLLAVLIVITALNVWQAERIESKQIQVLDRLSELEKQLVSGAFTSNGSSGSGPVGGIFGVPEPDYVTKALMDPTNVLKRGHLEPAFGFRSQGIEFPYGKRGGRH